MQFQKSVDYMFPYVFQEIHTWISVQLRVMVVLSNTFLEGSLLDTNIRLAKTQQAKSSFWSMWEPRDQQLNDKGCIIFSSLRKQILPNGLESHFEYNQ